MKKTITASALALTLTASAALAEGREAQISAEQVTQAMVSSQGSLTGGSAASSAGVMVPLILLTLIMVIAATASGDPYVMVYPD